VDQCWSRQACRISGGSRPWSGTASHQLGPRFAVGAMRPPASAPAGIPTPTWHPTGPPWPLGLYLATGGTGRCGCLPAKGPPGERWSGCTVALLGPVLAVTLPPASGAAAAPTGLARSAGPHGWSQPVRVAAAPDVSRSDQAVAIDGRAVWAWISNHKLYAVRRLPGGVWTAPPRDLGPPIRSGQSVVAGRRGHERRGAVVIAYARGSSRRSPVCVATARILHPAPPGSGAMRRLTESSIRASLLPASGAAGEG